MAENLWHDLGTSERQVVLVAAVGGRGGQGSEPGPDGVPQNWLGAKTCKKLNSYLKRAVEPSPFPFLVLQC